MADTLTISERSKRMALIKSRNTGPEMVLRRLIHAMGFRYKLHDGTLPGKPDLAFTGRRKVIFVHGCFWHRHPAKRCKLARMPKSKIEFWRTKLDQNRKRDARHRRALTGLNWEVLTVWECQLADIAAVAQKVRSFLMS